jgi:hypothetical protein
VSVSSARQELFPDLADDVVLDIEEDPFVNDETDEETSSDTADGDVYRASAS